MPSEYQVIEINILPEPYDFQVGAIQTKKLTADERAVAFAYDISALEKSEAVSRELLEAPELKEYIAVPIPGTEGEFVQYTNTPEEPNLGIIITPIDTAIDLNGKPTRIVTDEDGLPVFYKMGPKSIKMALAARADWFRTFHNPEMYAHLRALRDGDIETVERTNEPSPVINDLLKVVSLVERSESDDLDIPEREFDALYTDIIQKLGYARQYSEEKRSRRLSAEKGLFLMSTGIPSSVYALGGMPPVTGWSDVVETAALMYMRSWIPRNSLFVNQERQLQLFRNVRDRIQALQLPADIQDIVIRQIGLCVGTENPTEIEAFTKKAAAEGVSAIRVYTTNPDYRTVDTARVIRNAGGEDMVICVAPIVDIKQAEELIQPDIRTNILLAGHGGGENCTSLSAGGAANALELIYLMSLNSRFNQTAIGFEGGTGPAIGGILGMVDVISMNRRGVGGGIETGGLFIKHKNGRAVQPYHGSASPITQWIEYFTDEKTGARRVRDSAKIDQVEGKPGYMHSSRSVQTIMDNFAEARMYAGRALADQRSNTVYELRKGYKHRIVTPEAIVIAGPHGANS